MPSRFSNLNFADQHDIANWKQQCAEQRKIALRWPAYEVRMSGVVDYGWMIGPWSVRLLLEIWRKPYWWHASAAIIEQIGYESVTVDKGLYKGIRMEIPQDALLAVKSWHPEHFEQARFLMAEMLGPYLTSGDKHQPAEEHEGLWALHYRVRYDGPPTWKGKQH